MCRITEEENAEGEPERKVYGVLTDYDLSSWTEELKRNYNMSSQQRTGTPPYMAHELLEGTATAHLYRHDIESLFYIMLLVCGRHTFGEAKDRVTKNITRRMVMQDGTSLPYQDWFEESNYSRLGSNKGAFFTKMMQIELPPTFECFRLWLLTLQSKFSKGFSHRNLHIADLTLSRGLGVPADELPSFDDENLNGHIDYPGFIGPVRGLRGELKGLIIRYDPKDIPQTPLSATRGGN